MTNVFITGDAYMSASYPTLVAVELLRARNARHDIVAVDYPGAVPVMIAGLAKQAGVELSFVKPNEGGDLDAFHGHVLEAYSPIEVVFIHDEPMVSTVYQSLDRVVSDDKLRLVSYADLMV